MDKCGTCSACDFYPITLSRKETNNELVSVLPFATPTRPSPPRGGGQTDELLFGQRRIIYISIFPKMSKIGAKNGKVSQLKIVVMWKKKDNSTRASPVCSCVSVRWVVFERFRKFHFQYWKFSKTYFHSGKTIKYETSNYWLSSFHISIWPVGMVRKEKGPGDALAIGAIQPWEIIISKISKIILKKPMSWENHPYHPMGSTYVLFIYNIGHTGFARVSFK